MSAFLCTPRHISYIVSHAMNSRIYPSSPTAICDLITYTMPEDFKANTKESDYAKEIANILMKENVRSVNCRYSEESECETDFFKYIMDTEHVQCLKLIHSLRYQSCESPDRNETLASKILNELERHCMHKILSLYTNYDKESCKWAI